MNLPDRWAARVWAWYGRWGRRCCWRLVGQFCCSWRANRRRGVWHRDYRHWPMELVAPTSRSSKSSRPRDGPFWNNNYNWASRRKKIKALAKQQGGGICRSYAGRRQRLALRRRRRIKGRTGRQRCCSSTNWEPTDSRLATNGRVPNDSGAALSCFQSTHASRHRTATAPAAASVLDSSRVNKPPHHSPLLHLFLSQQYQKLSDWVLKPLFKLLISYAPSPRRPPASLRRHPRQPHQWILNLKVFF